MINRVRAAQLIYGRVESPYSSQSRDGFQTVYKSESLSAEDVSNIERRVQCFLPEAPEATRYQFFRLESGAVALTSTSTVESHPEIIDKNQRKGAFLAHVLVMSIGEFLKIDNDPFAILDVFHPIDDAEKMVETFGQATGLAPEVDIEPSLEARVPVSQWSGDEARVLSFLGLEAEGLVRQRRSILLAGTEVEIVEALRTVLFLLPADRRSGCSFDTCADGCPVREGSYWAIGMPKRRRGDYVQVDVAARRAISPPPVNFNRQDFYFAWLDEAITKGEFADFMGRVPTVQRLSRAFAGRFPPQPGDLEEDACREFMRLHEDRIIPELESTMSTVTGRNAARAFVSYLRDAMDIQSFLVTAAAKQMDPAQMGELAVSWIIAEKPTLKDNEWKVFQDLAKASGNLRLLHLSTSLCKRVDEKTRGEALARMDEKTFSDALIALMNPLEPEHFASPEHLAVLLSDKRLDRMSEEAFVQLVDAIIKAGGAGHLVDLAVRVPAVQTRDALSDLEKVIKKYSHIVPLEFEGAVRRRREKLGRSSGFLRLFRK